MIKIASWFNTSERISSLQFEAGKWLGTPFFANGNTPGRRGGVSCQKLVSEIYKACGFCSIEVPNVSMSHARYSKESLVEKFMDERTEMVRLPNGPAAILDGDLLGFCIRDTIHHLGIVIGAGIFIHAIERIGVEAHSLCDPTYGNRLGAIWRPRP